MICKTHGGASDVPLGSVVVDAFTDDRSAGHRPDQ